MILIINYLFLVLCKVNKINFKKFTLQKCHPKVYNLVILQVW